MALLVASAVDLGFTTASTETDVRTTTQATMATTTELPDGIVPGLLGYDVVSDLQDTGAIGNLVAVTVAARPLGAGQLTAVADQSTRWSVRKRR